MPTVKTCSKCGEAKPLDQFHKDKSKRYGRVSRCKECKAEYRRRYYGENREETLEYSRRYCEENREEIREYRRHYREENREEIREYHRRYNYENREVLNAKISSHWATNQELSKALSSIESGAPWSEEEDALLMADNGMTTYEKAIHLGRTYESCLGRRKKLKKLRRTTNA